MHPTSIESHQVTPDIHVIGNHTPVPGFGHMAINAYLVKGKNPYLIDTGMVPERDNFLKVLSKLIDPADLKWIFLTHDDSDHIGALHAILQRAPKAKVVTSFLGMGRLSLHSPLAPPQVYFLNPGETIDIGDRELTAAKPPIFDSPATTAIFDPKHKALFSSDSFGGPLQNMVQSASDVPAGAMAEAQTMWGSFESPWVHNMDRKAFAKTVNAMKDLGPEWVLSTHFPPAKGMIDTFCKTMTKLPDAKPFVGPNQAAFQEMLKKMGPPPDKH
jgi:flavorubredoxin